MTDDQDPADTAAARVNDAIHAALSDRPEMVTKWTAVVEFIDADGERGCYTINAPDAAQWDTVGLLTFALHVQAARHIGG